jgi:hypothetical protein
MRIDSGMILGWKYNHAEGITTVDGVIRDWPSTLGEKPTEAQIDAWGVEYDAMVAAAEAAEQARIDKKLADIAGALPNWSKYRAELTALIDAAQAAANFADLRRVVIDLCQRYRKDAKVIYWLAKDKDD